ncbi:sugar-binding protein [Dokdonia ponticola]|uniref:Sugar-binding protein n=1 Tax=Dokdonia ponticola TaxID=2041041 RepID=A0ABV9HSY7_9FLAO
MKNTFILLLCICTTFSCKFDKESNEDVAEVFLPKTDHQLRQVPKAIITPTVDGIANDPAWEHIPWNALDQRWLGETYTKEDFSGRYKLTWTPEALYLLAEIEDDVLYDQNKDPLTLWWDDDCLEIFVDADNSGGGHQFTHNAFAYHVALDGHVVDIAPGEVPTLYDNHIKSVRKTTGNTTLWECEIFVYEDTYIDHTANETKILAANQKLGFALAYCDNDSSEQRENFIGSVPVEGDDKNRGWIDAGIFGTIQLTENTNE